MLIEIWNMVYNYKNKIDGIGYKYISRSVVVKKIISFVIIVENIS